MESVLAYDGMFNMQSLQPRHASPAAAPWFFPLFIDRESLMGDNTNIAAMLFFKRAHFA
jgi:hypothetical protein